MARAEKNGDTEAQRHGRGEGPGEEKHDAAEGEEDGPASEPADGGSGFGVPLFPDEALTREHDHGVFGGQRGEGGDEGGELGPAPGAREDSGADNGSEQHCRGAVFAREEPGACFDWWRCSRYRFRCHDAPMDCRHSQLSHKKDGCAVT